MLGKTTEIYNRMREPGAPDRLLGILPRRGNVLASYIRLGVGSVLRSMLFFFFRINLLIAWESVCETYVLLRPAENNGLLSNLITRQLRAQTTPR